MSAQPVHTVRSRNGRRMAATPFVAPAPTSTPSRIDRERQLRRALADAFGRVVPPVTPADLTEAGRTAFAVLAYSRTATAAGITSLPADAASRVRREVLDALVADRLAAAATTA